MGLFIPDQSITCIAGPAGARVAPDGPFVLCCVRDGQNLVDSFVEHHTSLGFRHFFFLDNGSTDQTVHRISSFPHVTLFQSALPYREFKLAFKRFLVSQAPPGSWCLLADIDEFLELPSRLGGLSSLTTRLDARGATRVVTQMLDMFSPLPLTLLTNETGWGAHRLRAAYDHYDLTAVVAEPYVAADNVSVPNGIRKLKGGIRRAVFGVNPRLSKEALFRAGAPGTLVDSHRMMGGPLAELTLPLLHFKFHSGFASQVEAAVLARSYWNDSMEYRGYSEVLRRTPGGGLYRSSAQRLVMVDQLISAGFLAFPDTPL